MHQQTASGNGDDYLTCPACSKIFTSCRPYKGKGLHLHNDEEMDDSPDHTPGYNSGNKRYKRSKDGYEGDSKGRDALGFEPIVADSTWVSMSDTGEIPLAPSSKTAILKAILLKGFNDAPMDKVLSPTLPLNV